MPKQLNKYEQEMIEQIFENKKEKIKVYASKTLFKNQSLVDDVVSETFTILCEKLLCEKYNYIKEKIIEDNNNIDPYLSYWIRDARNKVLEEKDHLIRKIKSDNIKDFYEKVQLLKQKGYDEGQAKEWVIIEESILRHRIVYKIDNEAIGRTSGGEKKNPNQWYDILCKNPDTNYFPAIRPMIEGENKALYDAIKDFREICLQKWRNRNTQNSERDYLILLEMYFKEDNKTQTGEDLGKDFNIGKSRVSQIVKKGKIYINNCIKNEVFILFKMNENKKIFAQIEALCIENWRKKNANIDQEQDYFQIFVKIHLKNRPINEISKEYNKTKKEITAIKEEILTSIRECIISVFLDT